MRNFLDKERGHPIEIKVSTHQIINIHATGSEDLKKKKPTDVRERLTRQTYNDSKGCQFLLLNSRQSNLTENMQGNSRLEQHP